MKLKKLSQIFIPNVSKLPSQKMIDRSNELAGSQGTTEFDKLLKSQNSQELSISGHASKRLEQRSIQFDSNEYMKIKEAVSKLKGKGAKDSLIVTDKAAYVVDVKNNKLVTAVDRGSMNDNVFTKIDSTVFIN